MQKSFTLLLMTSHRKRRIITDTFIYFRIKALNFKYMQCNNNMHLNVIIYDGKSAKPLLLKVSLFFNFEMLNCHQQHNWWYFLVLHLRHTSILMLMHQNTL